LVVPAQITAGLGVATLPDHAPDGASLIRAAGGRLDVNGTGSPHLRQVPTS
jgi:hypothetical protein